MAVAIKEAQRRIKTHLAPLQRSMQLYLANKETEFILFRPIRVRIIVYELNYSLVFSLLPYKQGVPPSTMLL